MLRRLYRQLKSKTASITIAGLRPGDRLKIVAKPVRRRDGRTRGQVVRLEIDHEGSSELRIDDQGTESL